MDSDGLTRRALGPTHDNSSERQATQSAITLKLQEPEERNETSEHVSRQLSKLKARHLEMLALGT